MAQQSWQQGGVLPYMQQQQQPQAQMAAVPPPPWQQISSRSPSIGFQSSYPPSYIAPQQQQQQQQLRPPQQMFGQRGSWSVPPYQQSYAQQDCCEQMCCCVPGQPNPCDSSGGMGFGAAGCCACGNGPMDPYCCGPPTKPSCTDCFASCCDYTYCVLVFFTALSLVGFITVLVLGGNDDIFKRFAAQNSAELQRAIQGLVVEKDTCTRRHFLSLSGVVCLEGNLNANMFAVQLSSWSTQRDTMYFLAFIFSIFTLIYATFINCQRRRIEKKSNMTLIPPPPQQQQQQDQQQTEEQQQEQQGKSRQKSASKGKSEETPRDGEKGIVPQEQYQQQPPSLSPSQRQQIMQLPSGNKKYENAMREGIEHGMKAAEQQPKQSLVLPTSLTPATEPIELYGTSFYEFMRIAWFVMGVAVFFWACNLLYSFWTVYSFYHHSTTGPLQKFFDEYSKRFVATVICATIYLAWPLVNIFVELALWVVFFLPWIIFRTMCKPGIGNLRPALPLDEVPGYIRLDMFFMDFNDIKRLGFSEPAWRLMTGSSEPWLSCREDPSIDRDPTMAAWQQYNYEWYVRMQGMYPMAMTNRMSQQLPQPPAAPVTVEVREERSNHGRRHSSSNRHHRHRSPRSSWTPTHTDTVSPAGAGGVTAGASAPQQTTAVGAPAAESTTPRRQHSNSDHRRHREHTHRSRSSRTAGGGGEDDGGEANNRGGESRSRHRHHRSSSRHNRNDGNQNNSVGHSNRINTNDLDRMLEEL